MSNQKNTKAPHQKKQRNSSKALPPPDQRNMVFGYGEIPYCPIVGAWALPDGKNQRKRYIKCPHTAYRFAKKANAAIMECSNGRPKNIPYTEPVAYE